jgi:acetyltransferase-like isoleucine patch superfamily enzyme
MGEVNMIIGKLFHKYKTARAKNSFKNNAEIGRVITFMYSAKCQNTGPKGNVTIGDHCTLGALFQALYGGKIKVGRDTYIGPHTIIQSKEAVNIGDNVIIANNVLIVDNNNHPTSPEMRLAMSKCENYLLDKLWSWEYAESNPVSIESNVWIGRDARILKGVTIGKGSIVGLGAVVTHDVPAYSVVAGNPAVVVKELMPPVLVKK